MILLESILHEAINPGLALLPVKMDTPEARVMMLAIGLQKSRFMFRFQKLIGSHDKGPARGFWQFERAGNTLGVLNHASTQLLSREVCACRSVAPNMNDVWAALETDDILAAAFARLLLWTDHAPLPKIDASHDEAWHAYYRGWRPDHPIRATWDAFHDQARGQVMA